MEDLKSLKFSWKVYSILGLNIKYFKNDRAIEKDMLICRIYKTIMYSINGN